MSYAKILSVGSYLPDTVVTNFDFSEYLDTSDEWIKERSGIIERRFVTPGDSVVSMAVQAANAALAKTTLAASDIDLIIVATTAHEHLFPSAACQVQKQLNIKNCACFDLQAACTGFVYAMSIAEKFIRTNACKNALVIGSEVMSKLVDMNDRRTAVLFGDGAGAVILSASSEPGILVSDISADGHLDEILYIKNAPNSYMQMEGNKVFKFAVNKLEEITKNILVAAGFSIADLDWLVPHQANIRILQACCEKLGLPFERCMVTLDKHGNTSSASVPIALDFGITNQQIKPGHLVLLEGFGGGMTWGSILVRL